MDFFERAENVSQCQGAGCQHGCKPSADGPLCFCKEGSQPNGTDCVGEIFVLQFKLKCVLNLIFWVVKMRTSVPWKALAINYVPIPMDLSVANVLVDTRKTASVVMQSMV